MKTRKLNWSSLFTLVLLALTACGGPVATLSPTGKPTGTPALTATATPLAPTITPRSTPTLRPTSTLTPEPTSDLRPRSSTYGDVEIRMVANPRNSSKTDVYVENLVTGEEQLSMTVSDAEIAHYEHCEYHNGNLYITRQIGYTSENRESGEWTDELWRYDADGKGTKLFSAYGLNFIVAPDERYIALLISDMDCTWQRLIFLNFVGNPVQVFAIDQLIGHPDKEAYAPLTPYLFYLKWSDDSTEFWGHISAGPSPITFYTIKVPAGQITTYDASRLHIPAEYDLNIDSRKIVYSDCPQMYVADDAEEFAKSQQQVTLFVYDFRTQKRQTIATAVASCFDPKWLDDDTIEYNNPDGDNRVTYIVK